VNAAVSAVSVSFIDMKKIWTSSALARVFEFDSQAIVSSVASSTAFESVKTFSPFWMFFRQSPGRRCMSIGRSVTSRLRFSHLFAMPDHVRTGAFTRDDLIRTYTPISVS
jgi:hypothetical protein